MLELPFPTDLAGFVLWLAGAAAPGVVISLVLERIAAFRDWKSPWKSRVIVAIFVGLPFVSRGLAALLAQLPPETVAAVQDVLALAFAGLAAWAASQYAHGSDPARKA